MDKKLMYGNLSDLAETLAENGKDYLNNYCEGISSDQASVGANPLGYDFSMKIGDNTLSGHRYTGVNEDGSDDIRFFWNEMEIWCNPLYLYRDCDQCVFQGTLAGKIDVYKCPNCLEEGYLYRFGEGPGDHFTVKSQMQAYLKRMSW
jgi:hypothetical protein